MSPSIPLPPAFPQAPIDECLQGKWGEKLSRFVEMPCAAPMKQTWMVTMESIDADPESGSESKETSMEALVTKKQMNIKNFLDI